MFVCENCNYTFSYKESLPFSWKTRIGYPCPNCKETHYYTADSRRKSMYITLGAVVLIIFLNAIDLPFVTIFAIGAIMIAFLILLSPFTMKITRKEERLW
ncbi:TIGR04104 family putative zinc finger protein [Halalkalibacillus halophilus]|uniref:TIGR04104 family putative zinc finger protein n=1 Tax=Halalkalibacillus halophilus TaxID=392827 RepID=UPI0009FE5FD1|nr:TIGR04104 family putative zinc finger protein [Halalkalibacillus halophilus]